MQPILKMAANNYVPVTRTPWAGSLIPKIKNFYLAAKGLSFPEFIGESWEVSTDKQFPSYIENSNKRTFEEILNQNANDLLGPSIVKKYGAHCPLLLKWLHAKENLSVQVHPSHHHPALKKNECGKPEAWLVLDVEPNGCIYLGFKEGETEESIRKKIAVGAHPETYLNKVTPKPLDYISVPIGCVHAVGPGVLVAEPQYIMPGASGLTWRLSDWNRKYNAEGKQDPQGKPRDLHVDLALSALEFSYPFGKKLLEKLICNLKDNPEFLGDALNPFSIKLLNQEGKEYSPSLHPKTFSLLTVWSGKVSLFKKEGSQKKLMQELIGGETAFIPADIENCIAVPDNYLKRAPQAALFSLNVEFC